MSGTTINSQTQRIVVNAASKSISIINAGPQGPAGVPGPSEASLVLDTDGQLLTRVSGELAPITRINLAADSSFRTTINHGSTSGTARTGSHPIKWIGSVDPTNAANDDEWFNTSNARQYIRIASAWVNLMSVPVGVVLDYSGSTPPSNFLAIDGSTIVGGQTLYPDLWTVIPASWKSGANIVLPDGRGRTSIGSGTGSGLTARTLGSTGGSETHTLSAAESGVPAHSHTLGSHTHGMQSHTHSGTTGGINANHTHTGLAVQHQDRVQTTFTLVGVVEILLVHRELFLLELLLLDPVMLMLQTRTGQVTITRTRIQGILERFLLITVTRLRPEAHLTTQQRVLLVGLITTQPLQPLLHITTCNPG